MRQHYGKDYIEDEFQRIGDRLDEAITCYLIGGGAMAFDGLKDATKDIDLVVTTGEDFTMLLETAEELGYTEVNELDDDYIDLGAQIILENTDGCRLDIFHTRIVETLYFSEGMQDRATRIDRYGDLEVRKASREDIFVFKAVATRPADIEDMAALLQTGLDFDVILDEIQHQHNLIGDDLFITDINEALYKLKDDYGATPSLLDDVEALAARAMDKLAIIHVLDEPQTRDELSQDVDTENDLDDLLKELEEEGRIEEDDGELRRG